ncbi:MAG: hypothetical protein GY930_22725 [bacterium]|nr:hypothetical protein [bacterium]
MAIDHLLSIEIIAAKSQQIAEAPYERPYLSDPIPTLVSSVLAQGSAPSNLGLPKEIPLNQANRSSSEFYPVINGSIDSLLTLRSAEGPSEDGLGFSLRSFEGSISTWSDPNTWAYGGVVGNKDDGLAVEEAAVIYEVLGGNSTLRVGRFLVDFGQQMQKHLHGLRTIYRPAVLRAYPGQELGGSGVQYGNRFTTGGSGTVRFSIGLFDSLIGGHPMGTVDMGYHEVFQWGLSIRSLPDFVFDADLATARN